MGPISGFTMNDTSARIDTIKKISDDCKTLIQPLEIVTPLVFSEIFEKLAKEHDVMDEDLVSLSTTALKDQISHYMELNKKSSHQIESLENTSQKALQAMRDNDARKLRESIEETEALRREIEKLKESVYKDGLTRTWNRKWLEANYLDDKSRFNAECIVAIVDLNDFKQVNDTPGHIAGDKVLQFISAHLKESNVPVVRYGGDEFLLLFPSGGNAYLMARKKMQRIREDLLHKKLKFDGKSFKMSFSYGVAEAKRGKAFTNILEQADKQLYQDKEAIKKHVPPPF
jgi:diguanylate cyclase (GGDEF)-like protein